MVKTNSLHAWWLAARPKTLTGAAAPVILALSAAYGIYGHIDWIPALLCLSFALLMQVDANLVNDYFDCIRGVDTQERLGPERACSQGWITLPAMRMGIGITTLLLSILGLYIGHHFGCRYKSKAELLGGVILVLMGVKILVEHTLIC
jgi:1,4-dihydroxy-2-naphthoate octaprenyltransferase